MMKGGLKVMKLIKSILFEAIIVMVAFLLIANKANALPTPTFGDPIESGSWIQDISFPAPINIGALEMFIVADTGAGGFEAPGMDNFEDNLNNPTNWTGSAVNSTYALATGTDSFQHFDAFFDGDMSLGLTTIMVAWSDNVLGDFAGALELTYNMGQTGWALVNSGSKGDDLTFLTQYEYDREPAPIPEPTTIFLLGSGLGLTALAFYRRRHKTV